MDNSLPGVDSYSKYTPCFLPIRSIKVSPLLSGLYTVQDWLIFLNVVQRSPRVQLHRCIHGIPSHHGPLVPHVREGKTPPEVIKSSSKRQLTSDANNVFGFSTQRAVQYIVFPISYFVQWTEHHTHKYIVSCFGVSFVVFQKKKVGSTLYQEWAVFGKMKMDPAKRAQTQNAGEVSSLQWFFSQSIEMMTDKVWLHCIKPMLLK